MKKSSITPQSKALVVFPLLLKKSTKVYCRAWTHEKKNTIGHLETMKKARKGKNYQLLYMIQYLVLTSLSLIMEAFCIIFCAGYKVCLF